MTSPKSQAYRGPEWMLTVAIDDNFRITETMFAKDGLQYEIVRRATLKERLAAAKDASAYYAPKLSTVEHNVTSGNIDKMTDEELKAELDKAFKYFAPKEKSDGEKSQDQDKAAKAEGSDSESAMGGSVQQAADSRGQDQGSSQA